MPKSSVQRVISVAQRADSPRLQVELGGQAIENAEAQSPSRSTGLGVIFALIVLGLAFGALFAAFLPLITALVAIGIGYDVTGLLSHTFAVASFATILGVLIGLGVGVDYALFIVTRHRTGLQGGRSIEDSATNSVNTAGRAVFFAGITVCIAPLGQFALGVSFSTAWPRQGRHGRADHVASLTLLPALLGFFGMRVFSRRQRAAMPANGPAAEDVTGFWRRWAKGSGATHLPAIAALAAVVVIAPPLSSLRLGLDDAGSDSRGPPPPRPINTSPRGSGRVSAARRTGRQAAVQGGPGGVRHRGSQARQEPGVAGATPTAVSPGQKVAVARVYPTTSPQSAQTTALLNRLRDKVIPGRRRRTGVTVLVGGATATQHDFAHMLSAKLPLFIGVVVVLGFLLLMTVFRSLLIPPVASAMNLLSVGAALGLMNTVFNWGWGNRSRHPGDNPVEVFVPVLMISILFGLSMDYEVFLVSRIQEEWPLTQDNRRGHDRTGRDRPGDHRGRVDHGDGVRVVRSRGPNVVIKQFGIGLAGAILIDAFIVRAIIVPALMHLIGKPNWLGFWAGSTGSSRTSTSKPPTPSRPARENPGPVPRPGNPLALAPAQQLVQLTVKIDVLTFPPGRDHLERAEQEPGQRGQRGLEVGLAEWRGQGDVQHPLPGRRVRRPHADITIAGRLGHPACQQVPGEDPLNGLVHTHMKRHPDGVRILGPVVKTRRERNAIMLWNHESEAELGCDGVDAVHCLAKPLPCLIPERRASSIQRCRPTG